MKYLILLLIWMSVSWTASSQITGLQKETKQEIVKTLLDYPLVLEENRLLELKSKEFVDIIEELKKQTELKDERIVNKDKEIKNLLSQKKEYEKELDRRTSHGFIYGELNLNGFDIYSLGLDYVFKETIIIGSSLSYNNIYSDFNIKIKLGFKIF